MSTFALKKMDAVQGKQSFEMLVVDGVAPFEIFEKSLEVKDQKSLQKIYIYMLEVAN